MWKTTSGETFSPGKQKGKYYVLYFYPRDNTPGCTLEGQDFAKHYPKFKKLGVEVFGVSNDSLESHEKFLKKYSFPFPLVSDPEQELCEKFSVIKLKNMYGKKFKGIERSTFIIDPKGKVAKEWRKVKVPGHVEEVLTSVKELL